MEYMYVWFYEIFALIHNILALQILEQFKRAILE